MSQTIKLRRSAVASNEPTVAQLDLGEVAINTTDGKMYIKKDDGAESIVELFFDTEISNLTDVDTTGSPGPIIDDTLRWDGVNWVPAEVREGQLWQHVETDILAMSGTTTIPFDDTVPLVTEGTEFVTQDFTLINQYNDADMAFTLTLEASVANKTIVIAVFRDSVCIGAYPISGSQSNAAKQFTIRLSDMPGDELTHTYSGRIGITGGTWRVNLTAGGTLGGMIVEGSSFAINEAGNGLPTGSPV